MDFMDSTITLLDQGAGELVEDVPAAKSSDTTARPGKRSSDKVTDCSFTSERTVDSSFISAVSRLKSTDDTFNTTDFESAGEEDLEISTFGNSDPWFESLEYDNGNLAVRPADPSLHHDLDTDVTLRSPSVHSTLTNSDDCSILEEEVVGSTPVKTPRSNSTPERSWKIKRNLSENHLSKNDCDIFPCDNSPSTYLETADGRSKEREEVLSPIPSLVPNLNITTRRSLTPKRDPVNYSRLDKENVSPIVSKRHSFGDIKSNQIDDKNILRSPGDNNAVLKISDELEKSVLNNRDNNTHDNKCVEKSVDPELPSFVCQSESKPVNDSEESKNQEINIIINNDGITTVDNIKTDETLCSGNTKLDLTGVESPPGVTDESVYKSVLCDNTFVSSDLDKTAGDQKSTEVIVEKQVQSNTCYIVQGQEDSTSVSYFVDDIKEADIGQSFDPNQVKEEVVEDFVSQSELSVETETQGVEVCNTPDVCKQPTELTVLTCVDEEVSKSDPINNSLDKENETPIISEQHLQSDIKSDQIDNKHIDESNCVEKLVHPEPLSSICQIEPKPVNDSDESKNQGIISEQINIINNDGITAVENIKPDETLSSGTTELHLTSIEFQPGVARESVDESQLCDNTFVNSDLDKTASDQKSTEVIIEKEVQSKTSLVVQEQEEFEDSTSASYFVDDNKEGERSEVDVGQSFDPNQVKEQVVEDFVIEFSVETEIQGVSKTPDLCKPPTELTVLTCSDERLSPEEISQEYPLNQNEETSKEAVKSSVTLDLSEVPLRGIESESDTLATRTDTQVLSDEKLEEPEKHLLLNLTQQHPDCLELKTDIENYTGASQEIKTEVILENLLEKTKTDSDLLTSSWKEELNLVNLEEIESKFEALNLTKLEENTKPEESIVTEEVLESIVKDTDPLEFIKAEDGPKSTLESTIPLEFIKTEVSQSLLEESKPFGVITPEEGFKTEKVSEVILKDSTFNLDFNGLGENYVLPLEDIKVLNTQDILETLPEKPSIDSEPLNSSRKEENPSASLEDIASKLEALDLPTVEVNLLDLSINTAPLDFYIAESNSKTLLDSANSLEVIKTEKLKPSILDCSNSSAFIVTEEICPSVSEDSKPLDLIKTEETSKAIFNCADPLELFKTDESSQLKEESKLLGFTNTEEGSQPILEESKPLEFVKTEESSPLLEESKLLGFTNTEESCQLILEESKPLEFTNSEEGCQSILEESKPLEFIKTEVDSQSLEESKPLELLKKEEGCQLILEESKLLEFVKTEEGSQTLEESKPLELNNTQEGTQLIFEESKPSEFIKREEVSHSIVEDTSKLSELKETIVSDFGCSEKSPERADNSASSVEEAEVTVKEVFSVETKVPSENKAEMSDHENSVLCDEPLLNSTPGNKSVGMDSLIGALEGMKMNSTFCVNKSLALEDLNHGEYDVPDCVSDISSDPDHLNNMTEEEFENLLEPDFPPEMKPLDLNTTEAGPVTAGDDIQAGELSQVISDADVDISALKRKADQNADNSLIKNFDPLTDLPTGNHLNDSLFGNVKESGDVEVEVTPIKDHHVGLLIPITPVPESTPKRNKVQSTPVKSSTPSGGSTPSTSRTLGLTSQQDEGLSPVQIAITKELSKLQDAFKERMRIHENRKKEVLQKIAEAQKRKDRNAATLKKLGEKRPHIQKLEKAKIVNAELKQSCDEAQRKTGEFLGVLGNYEKALRDVLNRNEAEKSVLEAEVKVLLCERNTAQQHVVNMETALNDIHTKYDRSMKSVEELINGQSKKVEILRGRCKDLEIAKQKYLKLLGHASNRLEDTNREKMIMMRSHEGEAQRTRALIDQKELKMRNNDLTIKQKEKELREMRKIYEDLLSKLS